MRRMWTPQGIGHLPAGFEGPEFWWSRARTRARARIGCKNSPCECRLASHLPVTETTQEGAVKRRLHSVAVSGRRIADHRRPADYIPHDEAVGSGGRRQVGSPKQALRVVANQERPVGPSADERLVVKVVLDEDVDHAQGESSVAAGPHAQPIIRLAGETMLPRVNDDQLGAPRPGPPDPLCGGWEGGERVGTPQEDAARVLVIGWRQWRPERQF